MFRSALGSPSSCPDLVDFGLGDRWRPAVALIQIFGLIAAADQIGFNWDDYYRARAETRPIAVVSIVTMIACLATAIPLLILDGLTVSGSAWRSLPLSESPVGLSTSFASSRHSASCATAPRRSSRPSPQPSSSCCCAQLDGSRTVAVAIAEAAAFLVVTAGVTLYLERPLLREVKGYLRKARGPAGVRTDGV